MAIKAVLMVLIMMTFSCSKEEDFAAIHSLIEKGAALAEAHDVTELLSLTSEGFYADPGHRNSQETGTILWMAFRHYGALKVLYPKPTIIVEKEGHTARATIYFLIVKKERAYPDLKALYDDPLAWLAKAGENADLYRLKLELKKVRGKWLAGVAHLEPFQGLGFDSK